MSIIEYTICVGVRGSIEPGQYAVRDKRVTVSYPPQVLTTFGPLELPKSLSTMFIVSWDDVRGKTATELRSRSFERHLPVYEALDAISELMVAFKLVSVGQLQGSGLRTVGEDDTLIYHCSVDAVQTGNVVVKLKNYQGNNAWPDATYVLDRSVATKDALPHIGTDTLPVARRFIRCYELVEHGFYAEAFIVAFSTLDDIVQQSLHKLLELKGLTTEDERTDLLRGIKESRLRLFLGPILTITFGRGIASLWPPADRALKWLNTTRNRIAHSGETVDYETAVQGVYGCIKLLQVLHESGAATAELNVQLFRHAKLTASWTRNAPDWIPKGEVAESADFRS